MRKYIQPTLFVAVAISAALFINCAQESAQANTVIDIPTMQCEACAQTITEAVESVEGVSSVSVSVEKKKASINFASSQTSVSALESAIANAGYQANTTIANAEAYKDLPDCCKVPEKGEEKEHVM